MNNGESGLVVLFGLISGAYHVTIWFACAKYLNIFPGAFQ